MGTLQHGNAKRNSSSTAIVLELLVWRLLGGRDASRPQIPLRCQRATANQRFGLNLPQTSTIINIERSNPHLDAESNTFH